MTCFCSLVCIQYIEHKPKTKRGGLGTRHILCTFIDDSHGGVAWCVTSEGNWLVCAVQLYML